ncbi:MAG: helix-turn-helix domain-containing protein [Treponema sp.]|jgi:transcriptional regulator with XRE-family HTH domain|nr:helix-turn-helix domain-containing protein [Treponema sp.]
MGGQDIKSILGKNIKIYRTHRQFSQAILAEKADISIAYLSKIERGIKYPKPDILSQISEGLNVDTYLLFKSSIDQKPAPIKASLEKKKLLDKLSKTMIEKLNNTMSNTVERVIKEYLK